MPHFVIDCSEKVMDLGSPESIMQCVYDAALECGLFASAGVGGIKVRINPIQHFKTGDTSDDFIHVVAYILQGRTNEQKAALAEGVVAALNKMLPDVKYISAFVNEIERAGFFKNQ